MTFSSSSSQWFGHWIQEVSIKPAVYLRSGWFFGEYLTVYHVVFHTYNMSLRCITGGCSHEHKILLIEACWSFIHLENGTFFSAVFLCCWEIMCIFPSRKASNLPCFSLCLCVYVCKMSCMFGRQLINMIWSMKSDWWNDRKIDFLQHQQLLNISTIYRSAT